MVGSGGPSVGSPDMLNGASFSETEILAGGIAMGPGRWPMHEDTFEYVKATQAVKAHHDAARHVDSAGEVGGIPFENVPTAEHDRGTACCDENSRREAT
jgi:hypothetical protein